ncbi:hypothetical protein TVAG_418750 [Trichomonas vaginalis G3]|uniref:Uncharacterized protein n=1 Tax=Trichomonas vaginalis (strain ATCC PRA-98 / G3) TaxID=412133 RepID=A2E7E5_TRIV3|nr:hypothetical protein TVAGG3_0832020 [Trichomonas vaginalis G3]EAY11438.1 hypothetical protein TVAG_418750 [Trichomonas vaginalis G3]KAI5498650.1 hypothetical protein TVAGG3_0832020 [Trichomonas vaginalis G3]|eukprot:XP_001323661.1 hypothetical protein [Trichomonas vaginalis G3]
MEYEFQQLQNLRIGEDAFRCYTFPERDPAEIAKLISRPSRPITQISHKYANKPVRTIHPTRHNDLYITD